MALEKTAAAEQSQASIDVAAMSDSRDQHESSAVVDLVDDPEVTDANPIETLFTGQLLAPGGSRIHRESIEARREAALDFPRQFRKSASRQRLEPDFERHPRVCFRVRARP
jgi:hypothetical protein